MRSFPATLTMSSNLFAHTYLWGYHKVRGIPHMDSSIQCKLLTEVCQWHPFDFCCYRTVRFLELLVSLFVNYNIPEKPKRLQSLSCDRWHQDLSCDRWHQEYLSYRLPWDIHRCEYIMVNIFWSIVDFWAEKGPLTWPPKNEAIIHLA